MNDNKKVLLAMSGGVDSSSAALLLKKSGFEIVGGTMLLLDSESARNGVEDAKTAAERLGIPHLVFDFRKKFAKEVIERFNNEYLNGLTPNPCVDCNRFLKFSAMMEEADKHGCDYIATGHYARVEYDETLNKYLLKKAICESGINPKDQSYFLYNLTQEQLKRVIFPLGGSSKEEVRRLAEKSGLPNSQKSESQDICFVPGGDYAGFIEKYTGIKPHKGRVIDKYGNTLGEHGGFIAYTVGQRKGLGIAFGKPMYVTGKNAAENTVTVGENEDLFSEGLTASEINWTAGRQMEKEADCFAKTRYSQKESPCRVIPLSSDTARVIFEQPQRAIAEGQRVVFYDGDVVLGGGVISGVLKNKGIKKLFQ